MSNPTELYFPSNTPFPITVVSIDASTEVQRGTRLLSYSFVYLPRGPGQPETRFGTWDSSIEGSIESWRVKAGDVISQRKARDKPALVVVEPCKHGMQLGGLCVLCGKDMTSIDYTGYSDASRASIQMTHSANGPTVSLEEAQRIERETAEHLLKTRKLSLIVDLDQTIVHATVDPTVGEWISEGEAWEAKHTRDTSTSSFPEDSAPSPVEDVDDDEVNPNWEALKDVKKFHLGPESFGYPSDKGKGKVVGNEGCVYYIKLRPGWKEFLEQTAIRYEMHVYTMGTRAYAERVCAAMDPEGKIFGGRILSRDESGSLTQKSLQRLFPCDTSMVVIIDDRADVWDWSPNLLKVIPYDFFIGIGDINSSFLPKLDPMLNPSSKTPPPESPATSNDTDADQEQKENNAMLKENSLALEAQFEERPLAKRQEELQTAEDSEDQSSSKESAESTDKDEIKSTSSKSDRGHRKALLKNDDRELERLSNLLDEVHTRFFTTYDSRHTGADQRKLHGTKRRQSLSNKRSPNAYDVKLIIPSLRSEVLSGVCILFSSVIPLDTRPETTEVWRLAHMFGARCTTELTNEVTHVVAAKRGTVKVDSARKRGGIHIVWLAWFNDSIALWKRQDEVPYLLDDPSAAKLSPLANTIVLHSEPNEGLDDNDWDEEVLSGASASSPLELTEIDWNDINDEVEAAMNESDDDDDSQESGTKDMDDASSIASERTPPSSPTLKRKRLRSLTPSDVGKRNDTDDESKSPLAKRKKLAAERTGASKLKETISADDVHVLPLEEKENDQPGAKGGLASPKQMSSPVDTDSGSDTTSGIDFDDDFLARELEEEWG